MIEIGLFCVIVLAAAYWAALWLMGRREDVLHGHFVEDELQPQKPVLPPFPATAAIAVGRPAAAPPKFKSNPTGFMGLKKPETLARRMSDRQVARPATVAGQPRQDAIDPAIQSVQFSSDRLQLLLSSITRDLNDAAR